MPPEWLRFMGHAIVYSTSAFLFIAVAQKFCVGAMRRRSALHAAQRAQATIAREVLESRLVAMQAQVEPRFLFDSLVDIETLYRRNAHRGGG